MIKVKKLKKVFTQGWILIKFIYYKIYCFFRKNKCIEYNDCWLISEHGNDARDNGFFFFKYLRDKHPNINTRYIITSNSADFNKIKNSGKYIIYGSKEHYIAYITSKYIISTHLSGASPNIGLFFRLQRYGLLKTRGKLICLKHGITKDYLPFFNPKDTNLSLLISAAKCEYDYFVKKNGFSSNVVKLTGFARFDTLEKKSSKQILFMPTHRIYMHYMNEKEFVNSDYFKHINGLINNKKIIEILDKNDLTMIFYIHSEFYKYISLFKSFSKRIIIANINDYDVQKLLIDSALLITDYSSVFFDFAYMKKPIIYYQFDYDKYRKQHYYEGYFDYQKDGFGKVCFNENSVIDEIERNVYGKFKIDKEILDKVNNFFAYRDHNNCQRIYNEIIKLKKYDKKNVKDIEK